VCAFSLDSTSPSRGALHAEGEQEEDLCRFNDGLAGRSGWGGCGNKPTEGSNGRLGHQRVQRGILHRQACSKPADRDVGQVRGRFEGHGVRLGTVSCKQTPSPHFPCRMMLNNSVSELTSFPPFPRRHLRSDRPQTLRESARQLRRILSRHLRSCYRPARSAPQNLRLRQPSHPPS
jgi:hypothetical protein